MSLPRRRKVIDTSRRFYRFKNAANAASTAKHLEQLKGGRFPIEVLVRGKDATENEKLFVTITEKIKAAGVRISRRELEFALVEPFANNCSPYHRTRSAPFPRTPPRDRLSMSGRKFSLSNARMSKRSIFRRPSLHTLSRSRMRTNCVPCERPPRLVWH